MRHMVLMSGLVGVLACSRNASAPDQHAHEQPAPVAAAAAPSKASPHPAVAAAPAEGAKLGPEQAGGLSFHAEPPLVRQQPASSMRVAEYVLAEAPDAPIAVFYFPGQGGGIEANITRWLGQLSQADGSDTRAKAEIVRSEQGAVPLTRVKAGGRYGGGMAMPMGKAPEPIDDALLLGAIAEGPSGPLFFKWVGPRALLEANEAAFDALLASIKPQ